MYKAIIFIAKKTFTWDVIKTSKPFKFFWIIILIIKLDFLSKKDAFTEINISFLYKERFFATQAQCCLTFSWIKLQMLLRCCLIHIPIIVMRHILYLFLSMSRPKSIYVVSLWSIFHFQPHFHCHQSYNIIKTDALVFCTFFRMLYLHYF